MHSDHPASSTNHQNNIILSAIKGSPIAVGILTGLSLTSFSLLAFGDGLSNDNFGFNLAKAAAVGGAIGAIIGCSLDLYCNFFPRPTPYHRRFSHRTGVLIESKECSIR